MRIKIEAPRERNAVKLSNVPPGTVFRYTNPIESTNVYIKTNSQRFVMLKNGCEYSANNVDCDVILLDAEVVVKGDITQ